MKPTEIDMGTDVVTNKPVEGINTEAVAEKKADQTKRFLSLDVFRGATVCLMIIVNSPGKGADLYPYLVHADWFGFTLADLVFPSFLFAVGNSMSFSVLQFKPNDNAGFLRKVLKRTVLIFLIGYLMYWFPFFRQVDGEWGLMPVGETRIMGVLQRIALCYGISALMVRYLPRNDTLVLSALLLMGYWLALYLFGDPRAELTMDGNAVAKLDRFLWGEAHMYKKDASVFDPEGLLSTIPSIINVLAGYWVGIFIREKGFDYKWLVRLMIFGLLLVTVALWWGLEFPIFKKLWTSTFVLYTIGLDVLILAVLIYFIEIRKWKTGLGFFNVFGKNPLFIYLFSELLLITLSIITLSTGESVFEWISIVVFQRVFPGPFGAFITAIWFMMVCWLVGWWLDRRKIYIKI